MMDIIVAFRNTPELLNNWLVCVEHHTTTPYKIYLADNSDNEEVEELVPQFVNYSRVKFNGLSKLYNDEIKKGSNKYIAILNSDVLVPPNWDRMIEYLEDNNLNMITAVDSKMISLGLTTQYNDVITRDNWFSVCEKYYNKYKGQLFKWDVMEFVKLLTLPDGRPFNMLSPSIACGIIKRELLEEIGYFDEGYKLCHEDIDLFNTINLKYPISIAMDTIYFHYGSRTVNKIFSPEVHKLIVDSAHYYEEKWGKFRKGEIK